MVEWFNLFLNNGNGGTRILNNRYPESIITRSSQLTIHLFSKCRVSIEITSRLVIVIAKFHFLLSYYQVFISIRVVVCKSNDGRSVERSQVLVQHRRSPIFHRTYRVLCKLQTVKARLVFRNRLFRVGIHG